MPRRLAETTLLTLLYLLRIARDAILTIDDADPRIQYTGAWVPNTGGDPQQLNYMATLTYSNVTGTVASFQFTGSAVAVYGAFGPVGTFDMRSEYSIDRGPPTTFLPPNDIAAVLHRRQFFASGEIKYGPHVLTIENMGEQFWLDYVQVEVPDDVGTTSATATSPTDAQTSASGGSSTSDVVSPTSPDNGVPTAPTSSSAAELTSPSADNTSRPTQSSPHSQAAAANHITASLTLSAVPDVQSSTSTDVKEPQPFAPTTSNSQASGDNTNNGHGLNVGSPTMMPGAIAGVAVAGAVLLLGMLVVAQWWRKRRWNGGYSAGKGTAALGHRGPDQLNKSGSADSVQVPILRGAAPRDVQEDVDIYDHQTVTETPSNPLDDRSPASRPHGNQTWVRVGHGNRISEKHTRLRNDVPLPPTSAATPMGRMGSDAVSARGARYGPGRRRQSVDGGLRLAGGPPGEEGFAEDVRLSMTSTGTLPPSYQLYRSIQ